MNILSRLATAFAASALISLLPISTAYSEISDQKRTETYQQLEILANVLTIVQENYIEDLDPETSIEGAINGMLSSLDPHSSYLTPEDFRELQDQTQGTFSGIGIEVTIKDGALTIISPIEGSPGDAAGLKANDLIMKIDGVHTSELTSEQAIKKLRGKKGSKITISIFREGWNELHDIEIVRDLISLQSVKGYFITPGLAYTRISNFQSHTTKDFKKKLISLEKEAPLHGLILDLRNNPGGLLNQAVAISDLFLDEGLIVYTKGRSQEQNMTFNATDTDANYDFPIIILVNEGTASASEIVSGALQDHKRAIIVGTRSFGKGSVQTIIPLNGGNGIKLTTAKYYTPSGRSIQEKGIAPDVEVYQQSKSDANQKTSKEIIREENLKNHFANSGNESDETDKLIKPSVQKTLDKDTQLKAAYNILKSLCLFSEFRK